MKIRISQSLPQKSNIFNKIDRLAPYGTEDTIQTITKIVRLLYVIYNIDTQ